MKIFDKGEVKEHLKGFLVREGIDLSTIDKIDIDLYRDGQMRNIHISFIPIIKGEKENK